MKHSTIVASFPRSLLKNRGGESLVTFMRKVVDFWHRYQSDCRTKPHVHHVTFCPLSKKIVNSKTISIDYTSKVGEKQLVEICGGGANSKSQGSNSL